jgi:4-hydroxybenzoate polyprenyltransferase
VFLAALSVLALAILLQLDAAAIRLGVTSLVLVVMYPAAKRVTWWPQFFLGITFGWGVPMGYAATVGRLDGAAGFLYLGAIVWILGYDTIYAHQDREDDALIGVRSTARLFAENSRPFLAVCYAAAMACVAVAGWLAGLSFVFFATLLLPAVLLGRQVALLDIDNPGLCLKLFRANREVGLSVGLAILLGSM